MYGVDDAKLIDGLQKVEEEIAEANLGGWGRTSSALLGQSYTPVLHGHAPSEQGLINIMYAPSYNQRLSLDTFQALSRTAGPVCV